MSVATVTNIRYDLASLLFVRLVTFFLFQFVFVLFHVVCLLREVQKTQPWSVGHLVGQGQHFVKSIRIFHNTCIASANLHHCTGRL